jgi:hypothetical protein
LSGFVSSSRAAPLPRASEMFAFLPTRSVRNCFPKVRAVGRFRENRSAEREGRSAKFIF